MQGDGQCLYHAIGYHTSGGVQEVRAAMLRQLRDQPGIFAEMDTQGTFRREAAAQLSDQQCWGGALQIHQVDTIDNTANLSEDFRAQVKAKVYVNN